MLQGRCQLLCIYILKVPLSILYLHSENLKCCIILSGTFLNCSTVQTPNKIALTSSKSYVMTSPVVSPVSYQSLTLSLQATFSTIVLLFYLNVFCSLFLLLFICSYSGSCFFERTYVACVGVGKTAVGNAKMVGEGTSTVSLIISLETLSTTNQRNPFLSSSVLLHVSWYFHD